MSKVLLVEDSPTQALQIRLLLQQAEYAVDTATDGRQALAAMKTSLPDVVLSDVEMPQMNGLELVEAIRQDYPAVPVIIMTALGSEDIAVQALQAGAACYIPKRNLPDRIVSTLESVLAVAQASRGEKQALACLEQAEFRFVLDNDAALVAPLIGHLEDSVVRMQHCDRTEMMQVGIALHEALVNAIQHGNLEVSSELRQDSEEQRFRQLIEDRRRQPPYSDRRVRVRATLSPREAVYVVADEGPGFDPANLPDPTDPSNLERVGGRGLMLIRTFMDHVEFNERANQITMTKRHRGA
jgi:DNA-binding response OmpR family regulator